MLAEEFHRDVVPDKLSCLTYLRANGVLAPKNGKITCRALIILFYHGVDATGRLGSKRTLCDITMLMYSFLYNKNVTTQEVNQQTGHSKGTMTDWFNKFRETIGNVLAWEPKLVGADSDPVQIDESCFRKRINYRRSRLLSGNSLPKGIKSAKN